MFVFRRECFVFGKAVSFILSNICTYSLLENLVFVDFIVLIISSAVSLGIPLSTHRITKPSLDPSPKISLKKDSRSTFELYANLTIAW